MDTKTDLIPSISAAKVGEFIAASHKINPKLVVGLLGEPGIGKTDGVHQGRELIAKEFGDCEISTMIISQMESSDFSMPWVYPSKEGRPMYEKITLKDFVIPNGTRKIFFMDELGAGQLDVMKAVQNFTLTRRIGDVVIPDTVQIVWASNRVEDRAGSQRIITPITNRSVLTTVMADLGNTGAEEGKPLSGWQKWAAKKGIAAMVRYALNAHPNWFMDFDPRRDVNATPRQWERVSEVIQSPNTPQEFRYTFIAGLVGQAKATELETYIRLFDELPRKEEIIRDPKGTKLPSRADYMVPLSFSIVEWMNEENRDALITYLLRMGEDFQAMVFRTLKSTKIDLLLCNPQFTKWSIANQELLY